MKEYFVFPKGVRIAHWGWALAVIFLLISGFFLHNDFLIKKEYEDNFVEFHEFFGYILLISILFRLVLLLKGVKPNYLTLKGISGDILSESFRNHLKLFSKELPRPEIRNPFARIAYVSIFTVLFVQAFIGFGMVGYHEKELPWSLISFIVPVLGGKHNAHFIHYVIGIFIFLFLLFHLFMVSFYDIRYKNGEISSIVNGIKRFKEEPKDL